VSAGSELPPIETVPRDRCAFCGALPPLTLEHVWPQWAAEVLRARGPFTARHYDKAWRTPQIDTKVRAVCAACNGGWMSRMESEIVPILKPIILATREDGDTTRVPVRTLSPRSKTLLARWAHKTALTVDLAQSPRLIPQGEYSVFYRRLRTQRPDSQVWVWLGAYSGRFATRALVRPLNPTVQGQIEHERLLGFTATMTLGHAAFFILRYGGSRSAPIHIQSMRDKACLLWPQVGAPAQWPRGRYAFRDENIQTFGAELRIR
jgi:hypothetical protein